MPGWIDARGEPIRNPVTGEETRARINLPSGFEYDVAEQGRGWAKTKGPVDVRVDVYPGEVIHGHHLPPSLQTAEASNTVPRVSLSDAVAMLRDHGIGAGDCG